MSRFRTPAWRLHRRLRRRRGETLRVRGSRAGAMLALVLGAAFAVLGVLLVVPLNPPFGIVWTIVSVAFALAGAGRLVRRRDGD